MLKSGCSLYGMDFYAEAIKYAAISSKSKVHYSDVDALYKEIFSSGKANYTTICDKYK